MLPTSALFVISVIVTELDYLLALYASSFSTPALEYYFALISNYYLTSALLHLCYLSRISTL